jgi:hypothetical protein
MHFSNWDGESCILNKLEAVDGAEALVQQVLPAS